MKRVAVPLTLDAPARFLFWDIDYVLVASSAFLLGCVISGLGFAFVLGFLAPYAWSRARSGHGVNRALATVYWHLPLDTFTRVPASARRHFVG